MHKNKSSSLLLTENMPEPESIDFDTLNESQRKALKDTLQERDTPLVMRGIGKHWSLLDDATIDNTQDNTSFENNKFAEQTGESSAYSTIHKTLLEALSADSLNLVKIPSSESGRMFYNEDLSGMNFGTAQMLATACFDYVKNQPDQADYAIQCVSIAEAFPSLLTRINMPLFDANASPFIWIGNKITVAPHFDEDDNIAVVVAGRRRFTLFPPEQTKNLYIGPLDMTPAGQPISLVNLAEPDLSAHERYQKAYQYGLSAELKPGDGIFIPSPWWHHVESLERFNVLINYWTRHKDRVCAPFPMLLHAIQTFESMSKHEKVAWTELLKFYVLEKKPNDFAHIPEHARGVIGALKNTQARGFNEWLKQNL